MRAPLSRTLAGPLALGAGLLVHILGATPSAAETWEQRQARSTAEILSTRATIEEPQAIAAVPWLTFNPARARSFCDPGLLTSLERLGRDCAVEGGKLVTAMVYLVPTALAPGVDFTLLGGSQFTPEQHLNEGVRTLEDVATVVGVPVNSVNCVAKGLVRAMAGEHSATEQMLGTIDGATDLYQLFGFMKAGTSGVRALASTPAGAPVVTRVEALGGTLQQAVADDLAGTLDTTAGPTQAAGWFARIGAAWDSSSTGRWSALQAAAAEARASFEACELDQALEIQASVPGLAARWAASWRSWIELYELEKFCAETGFMAELGLDRFVAGRLEEQVALYRSELAELEQREFLDPDWAQADSLDERRETMTEIRQLLRAPDALIARALSEGCDLSSVRDAMRRAEADTACFDALADGPGRRRLRAARERLQAIELALPDLRSSVAGAAATAASKIDQCRLGSWREALETAITEFNQRHEQWVSATELSPCLDEGLRQENLEQRAAQREAELARLTRKARELSEAAQTSSRECRFDEAASTLGEARSLIEASGCPLEASDCSGGSYDPVRCSLLIVRSSTSEAEVALNERRENVEPTLAALETRAAKLELRGESLLELTASATPERCGATDELRATTDELRSLAPPAGCPPFPEWAQAADILLRRLEETETAFAAELENAEASAQEAAASCDAEAIAAARAQLEPLAAAACPPQSDGVAQLDQRLAELEQELGAARQILSEAESDWHLWMQSCDPTLLETTEARQSLLESCGFALLEPEEQARVRQLMWWGESGARLRALAESATPHLRQARQHIESASRLRGSNRSVDDIRQLMSAALTQAQTALGAARSAATNMEAGELVPAACSRRVRDEIADIESAMPELSAAVAATTISDPTLVAVPDLRGQKREVAVAWLEEIGLAPLVHLGAAAATPAAEDTVETVAPPPGTEVLPGAPVSLRVLAPVLPASHTPDSAPQVASQEECDRRWPGTVLGVNQHGVAACVCAAGTAWSPIQKRCLSLNAGGGSSTASADCSMRPGTIFDPTTGSCRCPVGDWDTGRGRCVDTAAAERQRAVEDAQTAAECQRLLADIEAFSSRAEPVYRQLASSSRQRAQALGCDAGHIAAAEVASRRFGSPAAAPLPSTRPGVPTGGRSSESPESPSGEAGGGACVLTNLNLSHAGGRAPVYLAYRNPSPSAGVPEVFGVIVVPSQIEQGGEVVCRGGRACLGVVSPGHPFQLLSEHSNFAAADAVARGRCPNPVHSSSYGGR